MGSMRDNLRSDDGSSQQNQDSPGGHQVLPHAKLTTVAKIVGIIVGPVGIYISLAAGLGWWPFDDNGEDRLSPVEIVNVDRLEEVATITNKGDVTVELGGWYLVSVEGNQRFNFPSDYLLRPGYHVSITSGPEARDNPPQELLWTRRSVWNNAGDPAELYSSDGICVCHYP
jgi:hypothetical protein